MGDKETGVGPARADADPQASAASRAMALIGGSLAIAVDPSVGAAAVEGYADPFARRLSDGWIIVRGSRFSDAIDLHKIVFLAAHSVFIGSATARSVRIG